MAPGPITLRLAVHPDPDELTVVADRAIVVLESGGTVIVPTDTVYGLASSPQSPSGLGKLFASKDRDRTKALAVLAADETQATDLLDLAGLPEDVRDAVMAVTRTVWPGGVTIVGPRHQRWQHVDLGGDPTTIGVRVPDAPIVRAIAARIGPIVTTSANRSGEPTPTDATGAARSLSAAADLVIDAGACGGLASTVVDVSRRPFTILRAGAVAPDALGVEASWVSAARPTTVGAHHE